MYSRLKLLRKTSGFTQAEFAEKLGIGQTYLSEIERGHRNPAPSFFLSLAMLNVNLNWLFTGKGNMFCSESSDEKDVTNEIISLFQKLPPDRQNLVLCYARDQKNISDLLKSAQKGALD